MEKSLIGRDGRTDGHPYPFVAVTTLTLTTRGLQIFGDFASQGCLLGGDGVGKHTVSSFN
jgi:hypothetical protein